MESPIIWCPVWQPTGRKASHQYPGTRHHSCTSTPQGCVSVSWKVVAKSDHSPWFSVKFGSLFLDLVDGSQSSSCHIPHYWYWLLIEWLLALGLVNSIVSNHVSMSYLISIYLEKQIYFTLPTRFQVNMHGIVMGTPDNPTPTGSWNCLFADEYLISLQFSLGNNPFRIRSSH